MNRRSFFIFVAGAAACTAAPELVTSAVKPSSLIIDGEILVGRLAASTITCSEIAVSAITTEKLPVGSICAEKIVGNSLICGTIPVRRLVA